MPFLISNANGKLASKFINSTIFTLNLILTVFCFSYSRAKNYRLERSISVWYVCIIFLSPQLYGKSIFLPHMVCYGAHRNDFRRLYMTYISLKGARPRRVNSFLNDYEWLVARESDLELQSFNSKFTGEFWNCLLLSPSLTSIIEV